MMQLIHPIAMLWDEPGDMVLIGECYKHVGRRNRTGGSDAVNTEYHQPLWMSSSIKSVPGVISPQKINQVGSQEMMNVPIVKCPYTGRDLSRNLDQLCWDDKAGTQDKKKSRKHQRYMMRRALEQNGHLATRTQEKNLVRTTEVSEMDGMQDSSSWENGSSQVLQKDVMTTQETSFRFGEAVSISSEELAKQPSSSQGLQNLLASPRKRSSPFLCQMPQKSMTRVAIDCEMVGTGPSGKTSELARCTVVSYDGDVIYDKYILPESPIVDYRTRWSGITWKHMRKAISFRIAQGEIIQILKDKIVVGHALHNDFRALKYFPPRAWRRDTSQCPLLKKKIASTLKPSMSLKSLAHQLLHKNIQVGKRGHSSVEDAQASMELYRLVEFQWEELLTPSHPTGPSDGIPEGDTDDSCYMDDQYWPKDLDVDCK
ncbi:apoptosis-enhancing nuclease-like isoform X1 [Pantherophis guttatus]|uniref:Apoptosis-enhancing nuclease-like isoform X1 n=2 Tax=Pantherophis guttatus TaxID=94885 RepID=A0A6P9C8S5_PANGU|nr:apoptosis-enhancing nuclease-like isoform X1 [Pantherophis guttatus]